MRLPAFSLRTRLVIPIVLAIVPAVGLLAWTAQRDRERSEQRTVDDALRLVRVAAVHHEHLLDGVHQLEIELGEIPAIRALDAAKADPLLARLTTEFPFYQWIGVIGPDGRTRVSSDPKRLGEDLSRAPWLAAARKQGRFVVAEEALPPEAANTSPLVGAMPLSSIPGASTPVVAVRFALRWSDHLSEEITSLPGAALVVIDARGNLIVRAVEAAASQATHATADVLIAAVRDKGEGVVTLSGDDGVRRVYAFTRLPSASDERMWVAVGFDERATFESARSALLRSLVVLGALTLALVLLAWQGLHALLLRRLDALVAVARRLRGGDLAARTGLAHESDDLAHLAGAFDEMAESLARRATEQQQAEERLRDSESRKAAILEVALDAVISIDQSGRIVEFNPAAEHLLRYSRAEALGRTLADLIIPEDLRDAHRNGLRRYLDSGYGPVVGQRLETEAMRSDGTRVPVELTIAPMKLVSGETMFTAYIRDVTERHRYEEALRHLSLMDELTGLYNRRGFLAFGAQALRVADRTRRPLHIAFADLDGLKRINDEHGHSAGDRALVETARLLRETFRRSDVVARIGGDEFAVLAHDTSDRGLDRLEARLRARIAGLNSDNSRGWRVDLSFGRARYEPESPRTLEALLAEADRAMYERKRAKREASGVR
jgi:diguanylate cyclase (GGDEF)-like protein/PAS domain S-box-containing protein